MPTHNHDDGHNDDQAPKHGIWHQPPDRSGEEIDASEGYEQSDANVSGILVFLVALAAIAMVTAGLSYGIGMLINAHLDKEDGPNNKWTTTADLRHLGNLPNSPDLQNRVAELANQFPQPRLQLDDGNQDLADLHAREDLLLDNYSWADKAQGKVRIPISVAMTLIAQRGLPVVPATEHAPLLTADQEPTVTEPLTNGFTHTGYEQDQARLAAVESAQGK
jgi:hypothetical protein